MELKSGEIYFVREREEEKFGPFVKIGLVHGVRDSFTRLKEHQTGNPRLLFIDDHQVVKTEAVDRVEAQLHRIFAPNRVSGEWFEFHSEAEVLTAVSKAKELAAEVESFAPVFKKAEELSLKESNDKKIPASEEALALWNKVIRAKSELGICESLFKVISEKLSEALNDEKGVVRGAATRVTKTYKGKFLEEKFRNDNPEIYARYIEVTRAWNPKFVTQPKKLDRESLDTEFLEEVAQIESQVEKVKSVQEAYLLNEPNLLLTNLMALSEWTHQTSIAKMKVLCGVNAGIEGVCTWNRKFSDPKESFNEKLFKQENPDLHTAYLDEEKIKSYTGVAKRKA
jgi:hypothetical protein